VFSLIIGQGFRLSFMGTALGLLAALALTRFVRSLLFEIEPSDPVTLVLVIATLIPVVFLACWLPARRATKVDPITALRSE
jgi:putative ABC transport system permease protein